MSEYIPTTDEVRHAYIICFNKPDRERAENEFNRWLDKYKNNVLAQHETVLWP